MSVFVFLKQVRKRVKDRVGDVVGECPICGHDHLDLPWSKPEENDQRLREFADELLNECFVDYTELGENP